METALSGYSRSLPGSAGQTGFFLFGALFRTRQSFLLSGKERVEKDGAVLAVTLLRRMTSRQDCVKTSLVYTSGGTHLHPRKDTNLMTSPAAPAHAGLVTPLSQSWLFWPRGAFEASQWGFHPIVAFPATSPPFHHWSENTASWAGRAAAVLPDPSR